MHAITVGRTGSYCVLLQGLLGDFRLARAVVPVATRKPDHRRNALANSMPWLQVQLRCIVLPLA